MNVDYDGHLMAVSAQITSSDTTLQDTNTKVDSDDIGVSPVPSGEKSPQNQDSEVEKEVFKPLQMDAECDVSKRISSQLHDVFYPSNQVHEVSANIEFQNQKLLGQNWCNHHPAKNNVGEDNKLTHVTITKYSSPVHAAEPERLESSAEEKSGFADSAKEGNPQGMVL
ncbi:SAFB-like transcription modulator [Abeliophyllum distichum]|uniref:SAFB-like transcription modulator n=1 Tax=Abeliophyllum distichum TaxID=126358 RepID=A0ABD1TJ16_9LAMI